MPQQLADALVALDGIAAVQIGVTDQARTSVPTVEKGMRQQEGFFAGLLIIEALDEASLRDALRAAAEIRRNPFPEASRKSIAASSRSMPASRISARFDPAAPWSVFAQERILIFDSQGLPYRIDRGAHCAFGSACDA